MKKILYLALIGLFANAACTTTLKKFDSALAANHCEDALEKLPENEMGAKLLSKTQEASGKTLSYALTGMSYTAEVLLNVVGGTVMFVALCGPSVAAGVWTTDGRQGVCLPGRLDALAPPNIGHKTYQATENLRCPNLVPMSRSMRKVASCYLKRETKEAIEQAHKSLLAIQDSKDFYNCLPNDEKQAIGNELEQVRLKTKL
jgi:hypothetical protein